jgi:diadenosine tetraphosphate (Ap4A) HIT family hydrolase
LIKKNGVVSLVGLGPLTPGYILILPEAHYYSVGETPDNILSEISSQKDVLVNILEQEFGNAICFEHGAISSANKGGACIDHAHIHVAPGCQGFRDYVSADFKELPIHDLSDLKQFVEQHSPYLFIQDFDKSTYSYKVTDNIQPQYLRRVWAKILGKADEWDWALFPNYNMMRNTFSFMVARLKQLGYC